MFFASFLLVVFAVVGPHLRKTVGKSPFHHQTGREDEAEIKALA
jgi:hypothetical protein